MADIKATPQSTTDKVRRESIVTRLAAGTAERVGTASPKVNQDDVSAAISTALADWYARKLEWICPLSWRPDIKIVTEDIFRNFAMIHKKKAYPIELEDIFAPSKFSRGKAPTRVLLEADPGFGKSEICCKLAYDWGKRSQYMEQFKMVFLLETKTICGRNIQDAILGGGLLPEDFEYTPSQVWTCIQKNQKQCLFIIDAYDQLGEDTTADEDVLKVFTGSRLRDCHVMLTCRTNIRPELQEHCDKYVIINEYKETDIRRVIMSYFLGDEESARELLTRTNLVNARSRQLLSIPMNVLLICTLWEDAQADDQAGGKYFPSTVTDLFTVLCKLTIRKYCDVSNMKMGRDIPQLCQEVLEALCRKAYQTVSKGDDGEFPEEELRNDFPHPDQFSQVVKMGLLAKKTRLVEGATVSYYHLVNEMWRDYLAAFFLYNQIKTRQRQLEDVETEVSNPKFRAVKEFLLELRQEKSAISTSNKDESVFSNLYHWLGKI
ncbi:uncharacterized protein LOC135502659 [Lineus longissimus]|uniref:uncharacterized protein LOC135502659 n=1 Tax=Lineus longissimus TaxID=88925 RepID=UPI002B4EA75C